MDSLALEILDPGELGAGNMIQVVAYKAGSVFAGAALLWVKEASSWAAMWAVFGSLYLLCLALVQGLGLGYSKKTRIEEEKEDIAKFKETGAHLVKEEICEQEDVRTCFLFIFKIFLLIFQILFDS